MSEAINSDAIVKINVREKKHGRLTNDIKEVSVDLTLKEKKDKKGKYEDLNYLLDCAKSGRINFLDEHYSESKLGEIIDCYIDNNRIDPNFIGNLKDSYKNGVEVLLKEINEEAENYGKKKALKGDETNRYKEILEKIMLFTKEKIENNIKVINDYYTSKITELNKDQTSFNKAINRFKMNPTKAAMNLNVTKDLIERFNKSKSRLKFVELNQVTNVEELNPKEKIEKY